ncbi:Hypothetical predicted protein [Mytilus galloprovincialis]|uniref:Uncharacterized protein n=1 Tax=Mytilus galloprovincialis TaxID=29158 RepID=A0A8B6BFH9_MYTGA|nr:Hypothetical predicted protein [Mytilus galloprovincialis]
MELISLVKKKKCKEAIELIKGGSNLNFVDENGCTCLHYASSGGMSAFIIAAAQNGVNIEKRDKKGQSPLDLAVAMKDAVVLELLCSFGSLVTVKDWAFVGVDVDDLNKTDQNIMRTLINQIEREAENYYGKNAFEVCYVNPADEIVKFTDVTLNTDNISIGFFLYCSKIMPEYTDISMHLGSEYQIFSDVFEIKTWGDTPKFLKLQISVLGIVENNQLAVIMPLEGYVEGNIADQAITDGEHAEEYTELDINIDLTRIKMAKFVILSKLRQEVFDVTQEAIKIIPQSERRAEIHIPEGSFKSPGKLMLNVANTNDWNNAETVLFTNVIDLTMHNNVQPEKPVTVKLPLHSPTVDVDDLIIIASHNDIPQTGNDWEICSTNIEIEGNIVSFCAEHFTR